MSSKRWERAKEIFAAARRLSPGEHPAYLAAQCGDDGDLLAEVESLLRFYDSDPGQVFRVARGESASSSEESHRGGRADLLLPGDRVGSYRICGVLGEGGMGVVYRAEQDNPRREVALKVIKPGAASPSLLRRFRHEAQILGRLHHPSIAQIFEAGMADAGMGLQPFFAMELVRGPTLTAFAADNHLGTRQRLELFVEVCEAVQHAHQKGVIHRDLKPDNILVESSPAGACPKVLDFGVARSTDSDVAVTTLQTDAGQLIGTIPYMSPEQCAGDPNELDTRSDLYALGVIAYELLAGRLPYALEGKPLLEAVRVIREVEPAPLSAADRVFRGDLETIVAKALEKDRERRYQSASDLAADLRRYLGHEPIAARPASATYRFRKFARRNKALVGGVATVFVVLVLGVVVSSLLLARALQAEHLADIRATEAQLGREESDTVTGFLDGMLASVNPGQLGRDVLVRDVLDEASRTIGTEFEGKPLIEARLRDTLGRTYLGLGVYDSAQVHLELAMRIRRRELGEGHPATAVSAVNLAASLAKQGQYNDAEPLLVHALAILRRDRGENDPLIFGGMSSLADVYSHQDRFSEAEPLLVRVVEARRRILAPEDPALLRSESNLAKLYLKSGKYDEAEPLFVETLESQHRVLGKDHPDTLATSSNLASLYMYQGRYDEAEPHYQEVLAAQSRVSGPDHPVTLTAMSNLALAYTEQAQFDKSGPLHERALEIRRRVLGDEHPETLISMNNLASVYAALGRFDDAESLLLRTLQTRRRLLGDQHSSTLLSLNKLAMLYETQGRFDQAEPLYAEAVDGARRGLREGHPYLGVFLAGYGQSLTALHRYEAAEAALLEGHRILEAASGPQSGYTLKVVQIMVNLYEAWDKADQAAKWRTKLSPEPDTRLTE